MSAKVTCEREPISPPAGRKLRVLVVEDHVDTAKSMGMVLALYGYEVQVALDSRTALDLLDSAQPDVVLLDLGMPGMSGWELAKRIRQQPFQKRCFLIAVSGYAREEDRILSEAAGIDLHLAKPVDLDELHKLLSRFQMVSLSGAEQVA
jgi:two-component system CheB/CheR fusion protein